MITELVRYAAELFRFQQPVGSGKATEGAHLRQVAKSKGRDPEEFLGEHFDDSAPTEPPDLLLWHWGVFLELCDARGSGYSEPSPISFGEIYSWSLLYGVIMNPWEVDLLRELDKVWMKAFRDGRSSQARTSSSKPRGGAGR